MYMKKNSPRKKLLFKFYAVLLAGLVLFVVHSCRKDANHNDSLDPQITDTEVLAAKNWYESAYPQSAATPEKLRTLGTGNSGHADQFIKPNWRHAAKYKRFNNDVIEMPLDSAGKFNFTLQNATANKIIAAKFTKTTYLVFKTDSGYQAYIMLVIADSAYVNNDFSKVSLNTYRKHVADFTGSVFYFTPKGKYVSGYAYKDGKLINPAANPAQSVNRVKKVSSQSCFAWYCITFNDSGVVDVAYMYTECNGGLDIPTGGGGGGPGDTGCPVTFGVNKAQVNSVPPDPDPNDPGFPPPGNTQVNCAVIDPNAIDITNNLSNQCMRDMVNAIIAKGLKTELNKLIQGIFGGSAQPLLDFEDSSILQEGLPDTVAGKTNGLWHDQAHGGGLISAKVYLNVKILPNASKEYIAATIIHELLHAYIDHNGIPTNSHEEMATKYFSLMTKSLQNLFTLSDDEAKALTWGGLEKTLGYTTNVISNNLKPTYNSFNSEYKNKTKGTGCN